MPCGVTCDTFADACVRTSLALDFVRVPNTLSVAIFVDVFGNFELVSYLLQKLQLFKVLDIVRLVSLMMASGRVSRDGSTQTCQSSTINTVFIVW